MYALQALMVRELDFKEPGRQERSFLTELRLSQHPLSVYVLGSDPEAPEEVQGLIGLTPDELSICQSLDVDLTFIFAWLDGEEEPEEGELVLADRKEVFINRDLFLLDDYKVLWRKSGGEEEAAFGGPPGAQAVSPQAVP